MAKRVLHKLSSRFVETVAKPGKYGDGGLLYLVVRRNGSKYFALRWMRALKAEMMGLGSFPGVSLKKARAHAERYRELLQDGKDPRDVRRQERLGIFGRKTFRECAERHVQDKAGGWSEIFREKYEYRLRTYVYPVELGHDRNFGDLLIKDIHIEDVLMVLRPIWSRINPTAQEVRRILEEVLDSATAHNDRAGENPARWRGNLKTILAAPRKIHKRRHHPSLPYQEAPEFIAELRKLQDNRISALALEWAIHAWVRVGVAVSTLWLPDEIIETKRRWSIPEQRMKAYKELDFPNGRFVQPLTDAMIRILGEAEKLRVNDFVFPSPVHPDRHLTYYSFYPLVASINPSVHITPHGFRSSARTWADECTIGCDWKVKEMMLAHSVGSESERAYARSDLFEKRRILAEGWSNYLETGRHEIVDVEGRFQERFKRGLILVDAAD